MNKETFFKKLKYIDDFYMPFENDVHEEYFKAKMKEYGYSTYKEVYENKSKYMLTNVQIKEIKKLLLSDNKDINPFLLLYDLDKSKILKLYELLAKMHNGLDKYDKYTEAKKEVTQKNSHGNIENKIKDIMDLIYDTDFDVRNYIDSKDIKRKPDGYLAIEYLNEIRQSLGNKHYTLRQLFQNLLYEMNILLKNHQINNKLISKNQIFNTVNVLIKNYFHKDVKFTTKTQLDKFTTTIYQYRGEIKLTHGTN